MIDGFSHIVYIDDSGDPGPLGSPLACLAALVYPVPEAVTIKARLDGLMDEWVQHYRFQERPELHCPRWVAERSHRETGLRLADRHRMMRQILTELALGGGRLVTAVLDKGSNQPAAPAVAPGEFLWTQLFKQVIAVGNFNGDDRILWCIDGEQNSPAEPGFRPISLAYPILCGTAPTYVDSRSEIMIQAADAAVYFLKQSILPSAKFEKLNLPFDISILDPLTDRGVLQDTQFVRLPDED